MRLLMSLHCYAHYQIECCGVILIILATYCIAYKARLSHPSNFHQAGNSNLQMAFPSCTSLLVLLQAHAYAKLLSIYIQVEVIILKKSSGSFDLMTNFEKEFGAQKILSFVCFGTFFEQSESQRVQCSENPILDIGISLDRD